MSAKEERTRRDDVAGYQGYHMTPAEFRRRGYQLVDWVANYMECVEDYPVRSRVQPGDVRAALPEEAPDGPESFDEMIADVDRAILPGITHWQSPGFFAYFPSNTSGPSILGELLSAGLGVQGMLWSTSPACTELETLVMDWVQRMLGLPEGFRSDRGGGGVIQDSASSAVLCAIVAARERATEGAINRDGASGGLTAYASEHVHSSVEKGVRVAGFGETKLRKVSTDRKYAMDVAELERAIEQDREAGLVPAFVCATVGSTSSHAFDPVAAIAEVCRREGIWLHVDAALAGTAAVCPEFRWVHDGLEGADSYCFNPHKWMFTNFDCDCFYVRDRGALVSALSVLPEYLRNAATESGAVIDYRDWQIPLGRRFRALKLWFVIRHYGVEGLRYHVRRHVELAQEFARWVDESEEFERVAPAPLTLVCFRSVKGDEATERIEETVNEGGRVFLTHTKLDDRYVLRLSVGQTWTEHRHVATAWEELRAAAQEV